MDWFALQVNKTCSSWNFLMIFAHNVEHSHTFPQNFSDCKSNASKKSSGISKISHFPLFAYANLGGAFSHFHLKAWLELADLAEFLTFFTKKGPSNIAASRLKIGRTYASLQPIEATMGWNLNRLFWPMPWWRRTFGLVCLAGQQNMFQLEFWAHFRTQGRAYTHVCAEVF